MTVSPLVGCQRQTLLGNIDHQVGALQAFTPRLIPQHTNIYFPASIGYFCGWPALFVHVSFYHLGCQSRRELFDLRDSGADFF